MTNPTIYPEAFLQHMQNYLGNDFEKFIESLNEASPVSVRFNPNKKAETKLPLAEHVPWCSSANYLTERPSFTFDPLFHAGVYYVQEASSMFLEKVWKQINPKNKTVRVLDLCAAPGGKSTHLLSLMNEESLLVSNEVIPNRNKILQENIVKWGNANAIICQNKTEDFAELENIFDIVVVDAPCSGEGLFRKDKDAVNEWSERNVTMCAVRQKEILQHAMACLAPGGFLIYSTCTFEPEENDERIADCGLAIAELEIQNYGQVKTKFGYQFYPHKTKGEGFYMAVLRKDGETLHDGRYATNDKRNYQSSFISRKRDEKNPQFLQNADNFVEHKKNDFLFAIPKNIYNDFLYLEEPLYIRHAGIYIGTVKGKDFLPSHDLALSNFCKRDLPSVELNEEEAISFLRSEAPKLKTQLRSWCLATYKGMNLGWMKVLDNRINNYFPKELRILKR
ncbi:MAG: RNA methyltransferase [Bacteroidetes bacterium]|nr:RNA methyltransferase [Bacteroidota bacterium]